MEKFHIETLISEDELREGIKRTADRINEDYGDKPVKLICVLKGGVYFLTELSKFLKMDVSIDFMSVSSYGASTKSSGIVKIIKDLDNQIEGENVIVVEDIIDSGNTLSYLLDLLKARRPASIKLATMLDKPDGRVKPLDTDYSAFIIKNNFVVGFGLDLDQHYRNLPYIGEVIIDD